MDSQPGVFRSPDLHCASRTSPPPTLPRVRRTQLQPSEGGDGGSLKATVRARPSSHEVESGAHTERANQRSPPLFPDGRDNGSLPHRARRQARHHGRFLHIPEICVLPGLSCELLSPPRGKSAISATMDFDLHRGGNARGRCGRRSEASPVSAIASSGHSSLIDSWLPCG
jgi:hypothetical protein